MKNKAYTLLELVVNVSIIMLLFLVGGLSLSNYSKNKAEKEVTENLYDHFRILASNAESSQSRVDIKFDLNSNLILFEKQGKIISRFYLPKRYKYSNNGGTNIHFNENGNVSPMFTFEVKDGNNDFFKLTFISTDKFVQRVRIERKKYINNNWIEY